MPHIRTLAVAVCLNAIWGTIACAQFHDPLGTSERRTPVQMWQRPTGAIPQVVIAGERVLALWDQNIVTEPGLSVHRLSTGETLWTLPARPKEFLRAWLLEDVVIVGRSDDQGRMDEYQWLDPDTGDVRASATFEGEVSHHGTRLTETLLITGKNEVFDVRTGARRGRLPAEVDAPYRETEGLLIANWIPDVSQPGGLAIIDLENLSNVRSWDYHQQLPEELQRIWWGQVAAHGPRMVLRNQAFPTEGVNRTSQLIAVDCERQAILWRGTVPARAPLWFVTDLEAGRPNSVLPDGWSAPPCLLIDWATGEQRPSHPQMHPADRAVWAGAASQYVRTRDVAGLSLVYVVSNSMEHLLGLDEQQRVVWKRELEPLQQFQYWTNQFSPFRFSATHDFALALGGSSFEIFDLRTGRTVKEIRPRDAGLTQIGPGLAPDSADHSAPATAGGQPPDNTQEASAVSPWLLGALGLLVGMLVLRLCSRTRSSPFTPSSASRES
jgi:hypothetical protein